MKKTILNKLLWISQTENATRNKNVISFSHQSKGNPVKMMRVDYKLNSNFLFGFTDASYFHQKTTDTPVMVLIRGNSLAKPHLLLKWLGIELDEKKKCHQLFNELFNEYFLAEKEHFLISVGRRNDEYEFLLTAKMGITGGSYFNESVHNVILGHIYETLDRLNSKMKKKSENQVEIALKKNTLTSQVILTNKDNGRKIESIKEVLSLQEHLITDFIQMMNFYSGHNPIGHYDINRSKEVFIYNGKTIITWLHLVRKFISPGFVFYLGTRLIPNNNKLEVELSVKCQTI